MRSLIFNVFFVVVTFLYAFICALLSLLPGRKIMMASLRRYTRLMVWGMRIIAKIDVQVTGHEHIPAEGPQEDGRNLGCGARARPPSFNLS